MLIDLPASNETVLAAAINPALELLPILPSDEVRVMLLAIGRQESDFATRQQFGGPAHGFWQNEKGGMVRGVLKSPRTSHMAVTLCASRGVAPTEEAVYDALLDFDVLAAGIARLGLWADLEPLPELGDVNGAWECYLRNWRPGHPRRETWDKKYAMAFQTVMGA